MATKLTRYIKQERIKQGLNYAEHSRLMGYRKVWLNLPKKTKVFIDQSGLVVGRIINTTYTVSSSFMRLR